MKEKPATESHSPPQHILQPGEPGVRSSPGNLPLALEILGLGSGCAPAPLEDERKPWSHCGGNVYNFVF